MGENEVRYYLNSGAKSAPKKRPSQYRAVPAARRAQASKKEAFREFSASHLFCPTCRQAMPVKERVLLYLPDGDLYEYKCTVCATSLGTKKG